MFIIHCISTCIVIDGVAHINPIINIDQFCILKVHKNVIWFYLACALGLVTVSKICFCS